MLPAVWDFNRQHPIIFIHLKEAVFQHLHGIQEAAFSHGHNQINGVKVFRAIKASCQIGVMIGGGMEVSAHRAAEPEQLMVVSHFNIQ